MKTMDDFRKEDGRIDWVAYKNAEVEEGRRCYLCKSLILFSRGIKSLCGSCKRIPDAEEFDHEHFIRCPKCGETEDVSDSENYQLYEADEHSVSCGHCGFDYSVSTRVSYSFTSPELIKEEGEN